MSTRRSFLAAFPIASSVLGQAPPIYDLLLKAGQVLDPRNGRNGRFDIAVVGDKIARVAPSVAVAHARLVVDVADYIITPGLIDLHTHFDASGADFNLQPDHHSLTCGVTTAVDAGSSGHQNFEQFRSRTIAHCGTRLLAWLNIVGTGMHEAEQNSPVIDTAACAHKVKEYPDLIVGVKAARFGSLTSDVVARAVEIGRITNKPVMAGPASDSGRADQEASLQPMRPGDIYTHCYSHVTPILDRNKKVTRSALEARQRGVLFDVGHGDDGFWFRVAIPAIQQGFLPDTISTDIQKSSILIPRANMTTTMSKLLNMGLTLEQIIERTTTNPAKAIRRPDLGHLSEGAPADIAVFEVRKGRFGFVDSGHARMTGDRRLHCVLTVRAGKVVWDTEGLSLAEWSNVGAYSNFK